MPAWVRGPHIINKRRKGRQMSSLLYFWLILHSILAVCCEFDLSLMTIPQIYVKKNFFTCLCGLVVDCKASYLKVTVSNPIKLPYVSSQNYVSQQPLLPPPASSNSQKIKEFFACPSVSLFFYGGPEPPVFLM